MYVGALYEHKSGSPFFVVDPGTYYDQDHPSSCRAPLCRCGRCSFRNVTSRIASKQGAKRGQMFPNFRPAVFVEKLEYPLEIFNLFFTQDSVWIYDFLVVYHLFLAYTMLNNEMTNERANKQRKRVCTHQIKDRTQFDRRKHTTMHVTYTHTCFPLSICS